MKLLLSSDLHGNHDAYRWLSAVAAELRVPLVLAGDLLGCPDGYDTIQAAQRADAEAILGLLCESGLSVFYIWGNDDFIEIESSCPRLRCLHEQRIDLGAWNLVGYQNSPTFVGGPHERP